MLKSPFRYPGSKSKFAKQLVTRLVGDTTPIAFYDVFVGGGSVAITAAQIHAGCQIFVNDADPDIAAFWNFIASNKQSSLDEFDRLLDIPMTLEHHQKLRTENFSNGSVRRAYRVLALNRTCFSGIITAGPIGGHEQTSAYGVACRYNPNAIKETVRDLRRLFRGRLTVTCKPASQVLAAVPKTAHVFVDPPYWTQGKHLYRVYMEPNEHCELAQVLLKAPFSWLATYDDVPEIRELYSKCAIEKVRYKYSCATATTNRNQVAELMIAAPHLKAAPTLRPLFG